MRKAKLLFGFIYVHIKRIHVRALAEVKKKNLMAAGEATKHRRALLHW